MDRLRLATLSALLASLLGVISCAVQKPAANRSFQPGERVTVGRLIYTVFDTQWLTQIGDGVEARVPQQRFFLVRIAVTNSGGERFVAPNLSVIDDHGTSYAELSDGQGVNQWIGYLRQLDPSDTLQGNLLFDVPPQHYKLRVSEADSPTAFLIDLPLDFTGIQMPEVAAPADGSKP